jgi:hypothetical protein
MYWPWFGGGIDMLVLWPERDRQGSSKASACSLRRIGAGAKANMAYFEIG